MNDAPKFIIFLCAIMIACSVAVADVAPGPGYKRISMDLNVTTEEDLSPDYRFFIKSGAGLKEVVLKKGETAVIEQMGGGAYYRAGTFLAVPKKNLGSLSEAASSERPNELQTAIYDGKVAGAIELVKHTFAREVRDAEAAGWQAPVYRIERDAQSGLTAVHVSGSPNVGKLNSGESSGRLFWGSAAAAVVAGIFLVFGLAMAGIWYFRKTSKQL